MSEFENIFCDVPRIIPIQPREAHMRYRPPQSEVGVKLRSGSAKEMAPDWNVGRKTLSGAKWASRLIGMRWWWPQGSANERNRGRTKSILVVSNG